jgi:hypothetical protein
MRYLRTTLVLIAAAATSAIMTPASARHVRHHVARHHHAHVHHDRLGISYNHNYGPGALPGTYAYYDGPLGVRCKQSAAAYRGQDGRAHPCF